MAMTESRRWAFGVTLFALACLLLVPSPSLWAQSASTGALAGTVTDASGAVVPNVTVTATNTDTGQVRTDSTSADGSYKFALLPPGTYRVKFEAAGFKASEVPSVTVVVTETGVLDGHLEVGTQTEQVTVEGQTETLQTSNATLGTVMSSQTVSGLPLTTRNYTNLIGLSAGANSSVFNATALGKGLQDVAVNGAPATSNNFQMDGASIVNSQAPGNAGDTNGFVGFGIPNPDALQEFKIQTSQYDAGYGRGAGANVNVVTKSGTNAIHGTAFEFFRNTVLNAEDFFAKYSGTPRGVLNQNQWGGVIGGPIIKDKFFFFGSFQDTAQKNGLDPKGFSTGVTLPPTPTGPRENTAAFQAALGAAICPANHPGVKIYQAATAGSASLNSVQVACDGSNINPVAIGILQLKNPDGTYYIPSSTNGGFQPTTYSIPAIFHEYQIMGNFDYVLNSKNTISTRYFYATYPTTFAFVCTTAGGGCVPDSGAHTNFLNQDMVFKLTSIATNNLVNEARLSIQRNIVNATTTTPFTNTQVGITSASPSVPNLDRLTVTGLFAAGPSGGAFDSKVNITQWEAADQLSWTHGKQTFRFGGEVERDLWNWIFPGVSIGSLTFNSFSDFLLGLPGCTPSNLSCTPTTPGNTNGTAFSNIANSGGAIARVGPNGLIHGWREPNGNAFVQDDIKFNKRLTVNLGLRWEYDGLIKDKYGELSDFWPSLASTVTPGLTPATGTLVGYVVASNYYQQPVPQGVFRENHTIQSQNNPPLDNFAPRIGFAVQPTKSDRFVVRGGFGYFYDRVAGTYIIGAGEQGPPYSATVSASGTSTYFSTLAQPYNSNPLGWTPLWANPATLSGSLITVPYLTPNFVTPLVYQWNLNTQYEFARNWVLELGYVGETGIHQPYGAATPRNENEALLASPTNPVNGITTNTIANANYRVPYLGIGTTGLQAQGTEGNFKSNDLQVTVRKQMSHGLQLQGAYTWIRAFTTANFSNDPNNAASFYGLNAVSSSGSGGYRPQRFVFNYSWDLPLGNPEGLKGKLVHGWNLSGVTILQNGLPLTITDGKGGSVFGSPEPSRAEFCPGMGNANAAASGDLYSKVLNGLSSASTGGYFNKAAFCVGGEPVLGGTPTTPALGYGNTGIGFILGPGQFNWDMSLVKTTVVGGLREDATLTFRTEFFNAFNHPQFSAPVVSDSANNFGQINSASVNPRLIQFALKYAF
jgi:hypothetical protein